MSDTLAARLRRLERQVAAFREMHVREASELAERLAAIAKLHGDELQLIVDESRDIAAQVAGAAVVDEVGPTADPTAAPSDPAASSPKRARWLAEQERPSHLTRRRLLRGRSEGPDSPS